VKILVTAKRVTDPDMKIKVKPDGSGIVTDSMNYKVNPFCEIAIEQAVRFKEKGGAEFLRWIGGYFEMHWSVNPFWDADFKSLPTHPVTRGVKPFAARDEWYYHMRFAEGMKGVTPILSALPPEETLDRPDGPHSGNPHVRAAVKDRKEPQHLMWVYDRPDGGRGFGFTGGHSHKTWGDDNFRKVVLNAIVWIAQVEVPANGVQSVVTPDDLKANLDPKGR